jgi:hypothetical protein
MAPSIIRPTSATRSSGWKSDARRTISDLAARAGGRTGRRISFSLSRHALEGVNLPRRTPHGREATGWRPRSCKRSCETSDPTDLCDALERMEVGREADDLRLGGESGRTDGSDWSQYGGRGGLTGGARSLHTPSVVGKSLGIDTKVASDPTDLCDALERMEVGREADDLRLGGESGRTNRHGRTGSGTGANTAVEGG